VNNCAESMRVMHPLFHAGERGSTPTSALQLRVDPIPFRVARSLNKEWHSRLPMFRTPNNGACCDCFAAEFNGIIYAVAIWSAPVARLLNGRNWFELRRMAVCPEAPKNTASRFLSVMTRLIHRSRSDVVRLISYQDTEVHTGGIYKACGWNAVDCSDSATNWDVRSSRVRSPAQSNAPKVRWEKIIKEASGA
jgi:hypothetical protein